MGLLEVEDLNIAVAVGRKLIPVVRGISFGVDDGESLGIVGESGCGKSLAALAVMGLLEGSPARVTGGSIRFEGRELSSLSPPQRREIMGNRMAMIFQDPMTSLNPVHRIGDQIIEVLRRHTDMSRRAALERVVELLHLVRIPNPRERVSSFPHQLSGGQRQRVVIAMALACNPRLLIADEPTTALDATVQKEVLELIRDLRDRFGMAMVLISHDLGVVAETCDNVAVMYRGAFVETSATSRLFSHVSHPYTSGLLNSMADVDSDSAWLEAIPGRVPPIEFELSGCAFHPRCKMAREICRTNDPDTVTVEPGHWARCHFATDMVR